MIQRRPQRPSSLSEKRRWGRGCVQLPLSKFRIIGPRSISNSRFKYCDLMLFWLHCTEEKHCKSKGSEKFNLMDPVSFMLEG